MTDACKIDEKLQVHLLLDDQHKVIFFNKLKNESKRKCRKVDSKLFPFYLVRGRQDAVTALGCEKCSHRRRGAESYNSDEQMRE